MFTWRLTWWQSGLFGAILGFALFYYQCSEPREHGPACSREAFFEECLTKGMGGTTPFSDLVITPQLDGAYSITCVSYSRVVLAPQKLQFEIPPGQGARAIGSFSAIMAESLPKGNGFMTAMQKYASHCFWLRYKYEWWREPRLWIWGYPAIGLFLLGGILPFFVSLWRPTFSSEPEYDLSRFSGKLTDIAPSPAIIAPPATQQPEEPMTAAIGVSAETADSAEAKATLVLKPQIQPRVESSPPLPATDKDFDGEYYPTEVHHREAKDNNGESSSDSGD